MKRMDRAETELVLGTIGYIIIVIGVILLLLFTSSCRSLQSQPEYKHYQKNELWKDKL